jgi:hypothetical protein
MSDVKTAEDGNLGASKHLHDVIAPELDASFVGPKMDGKKLEVCADINHVAELNLDNAEQLQKQIVRKLDTWMLPQLWILYMFNYLNRTNIAQARLNTFDEDLGLVDGDYQVRLPRS